MLWDDAASIGAFWTPLLSPPSPSLQFHWPLATGHYSLAARHRPPAAYRTDPKGKAHLVAMTEEGKGRAEELFYQLFGTAG